MDPNALLRVYETFRAGAAISTDTRRIENGCIYFALKGEHFNGNSFASEALEKGAALCVIDEPVEGLDPERSVKVYDVLRFMQDLANHHRRQFNIPVIGITGSNGKTTTKELVYAVLEKKYHVLYTQGNLNNHIGVPLTLLSMRPEHEIAVIEMGANHQGEIRVLCSITEPSHVLITNVGMAHLEGFGGFEGVKKGKGEMYEYARKNGAEVFLNSDDNDLRSMLGEYSNTKRYGSENDDISGSAEQSGAGIGLHITIHGNSYDISSHLTGTYNLSNVLAAACIGYHFNVTDKDICDAITSYEPTNSRSQVIRKGTMTIVADMYNANPTSMEEALRSFGKNYPKPRAIFLGAMHELGGESQAYHKRVAQLARDQKPEVLVFIGEGYREFCEQNEIFFIRTPEASVFVNSMSWDGYSILVKGSRAEKMENITTLLVSGMSDQ